MANLLYVTCNVRPQDRSRTLLLGYEFLEEYIRWVQNSGDSILNCPLAKTARQIPQTAPPQA